MLSSRKSNKEIVAAIIELRKQYNFKLCDMLDVAKISKSVYHYWKVNLKIVKQKDNTILELIKDIIKVHKGRVGYRRVSLELKRLGHKINHKKVLRIMREHKLLCVKFKHRNRSYKSYKGQVGKVAKNKLNRRFISDRPYQKLLTDVTQFSIQNGSIKLYLSPILDVYSKEIISYSISKRPTLDFVLKSMEEAITCIPKLSYRTIIHTDQGWHYQNKNWIKKIRNHKIIQSMSRKGNCLDNSPMENFFGLLKQEMFYGVNFKSYEELENEIKDYINYYNHIRRKENLKGKTPVEYRNLALERVA
ncbi:IS3 family transposase [Mammaliicoccus lentus]|uniref:IS3 family transposase n=1 Tax=Mammaliicoccus lentus TaxID=42858 RepID=UPI002DBE6C48|nr:IS3 family transposase [Mammaliicoccus lentus]